MITWINSWLTNGMKGWEGLREKERDSEIKGHDLEEKKEKGLKDKLI